MKTEASFEVNRCVYCPKPEKLSEFWNDCIEPKEKEKISKNYNNQNKNIKIINTNGYENSNYNNLNTNTDKNSKLIKYYNSKLFSPGNKLFNICSTKNNKLNNSTEKILENIYNRHPSYVEEIKEEEYKKVKRKNALMRCLGLYSYGLELKKTMKKNIENNDKIKIDNDLSKCTFKPKLNKKISYLENKMNYAKGIDRLYQNKQKKLINKSVDNINQNKNKITTKNEKFKLKNIKEEYYKECTFKPKFESDPKAMEKMFKKRLKYKYNRPSIEKINAEFILRYTKARDEYLIKRFKKLDRKDDSYDNSLISLTKRLCNEQYKNYLNVNNTISLFGETLTPNNYLHSFNNSIANFRGLSLYNEIPKQKKNKKKYIIGLRNNLRNLDLNENED